MSEEDGYKEATSGDVVKFEKEGDSIEGIYCGHEESKQYPSSYAVRIRDKEQKNKVVFVSKLLIGLLQANTINIGQQIKIVFQGKKKTKDQKNEYNDYKLLYK